MIYSVELECITNIYIHFFAVRFAHKSKTFILGVTIEHLCRHIHRSLISEFNYALVWGTSTRHSPQRCGLKHELHDQDVVQVVKRTVAQQKANSAEYAKMAQEAFDKYKEKKKKSKNFAKTNKM